MLTALRDGARARMMRALERSAPQRRRYVLRAPLMARLLFDEREHCACHYFDADTI